MPSAEMVERSALNSIFAGSPAVITLSVAINCPFFYPSALKIPGANGIFHTNDNLLSTPKLITLSH